MARRKNILIYPKEYFSLFQQASRQEISIQHKTRASAEATRNELYTFRQVLYAAPGVYYQKVARAAQNVRFTIEATTLTAQPIRNLEDEDKDKATRNPAS